MKYIIMMLLSINILFGNDCLDNNYKKLHDKFYKGYEGFKKTKKIELNLIANDYLEKSILMGLLAGDCQAQINYKEKVSKN